MADKVRNGRFPLFSRLFFSFLLFMMVPIIGFLFIFNSVVTDELTAGKNQAGKESLALLRSYVDLIIDRTWSNAIRVSMDPRLETLFRLQSGESRGDIAYVDAVLESINMTRSLSVTDESIHSVYLLNDETGMIVTSLGETVRAADYLDRDWLREYSPDLKQLRILPARRPVSQMKEQDRSIYVDVDRDISSQVITMILPLIFDPANVLQGAVIINLLERELFPAASRRDGTLYILMDSRGRIVSTVESAALEEALEHQMPPRLARGGEFGSFELSLPNDRYMVNYTRSVSNGLYFLRVTDLNPLLQWIETLQLFILGFSLSVFLFGMLAARFFARQITTPIKSTIALLEKAVKPEEGGMGFNELKRIQTAVSKIIDENRKIQDFLSSEEAGSRNRIVFDLIRGRTESAHLLFPDPDQPCACLLITIDRFRRFSDEYSHQQQYAIKKLILELSLEAAKKRTPAAGVVMQHEKIALILQFPPGKSEGGHGRSATEQLKRQLIADVLQVSEVAEEVTTSLSIGGIYPGLAAVRRSFLEAVDALNYRIGAGEGRFIDFTKLPEPPKKLPNLEIPGEKLIHSLEYGKKTEIPLMIDRIMEKLMGGGNLNYRMVLESLLPLVARTTEFLRSKNLYDGDPLSGRHKSLYELITDQETREDLRESLVTYYLGIFRMVNTPDREESLTEAIIAYIKTRFADPNLDLTLVADQAGLSYSHTRKIIKDSTGLSFIDYLNRIRVARAKELLADPGKSVRQVSGETGYHNEQSLSRFFKKYEGITPGEYKRQRQKNSLHHDAKN